jgi:hypothetical protein
MGIRTVNSWARQANVGRISVLFYGTEKGFVTNKKVTAPANALATMRIACHGTNIPVDDILTFFTRLPATTRFSTLPNPNRTNPSHFIQSILRHLAV